MKNYYEPKESITNVNIFDNHWKLSPSYDPKDEIQFKSKVENICNIKLIILAHLCKIILKKSSADKFFKTCIVSNVPS